MSTQVAEKITSKSSRMREFGFHVAVSIITLIIVLGGSAPIAFMINSDLTTRSAEDAFKIISADIDQTVKNGKITENSQIAGKAVDSATEGHIVDSETGKTFVFGLPPMQAETSAFGTKNWSYITVEGTVEDYTIAYGLESQNKTLVYHSTTGEITSSDYERLK